MKADQAKTEMRELWDKSFNGKWDGEIKAPAIAKAKELYPHLDDDEKRFAYHALGRKGVALKGEKPSSAPAVFVGDWTEDEYKGYDCGVRWNGWASPWFPLEVVKELVKEQERLAKDCAECPILRLDGETLINEYDGETERINPTLVKTTDGEKMLYDCGFGWTWEVKLEDEE